MYDESEGEARLETGLHPHGISSRGRVAIAVMPSFYAHAARRTLGRAAVYDERGAKDAKGPQPGASACRGRAPVGTVLGDINSNIH